MQPTVPDWWQDTDNLIALGYWMADNYHDPREIVYMFEKPWKHDDLWNQYQQEENT
jgi:hypothetical protein